jgi:uncharacterized OB-fold protein
MSDRKPAATSTHALPGAPASAAGAATPGAAVSGPAHAADQEDTSHLAYWERVKPLGFALPRCAACGRFHFYPKPACPYCGSEDVAPAPAAGTGTVYSYSVVHRAPSSEFAADVPYTVAIVATDEGPHLMTRIVGVASDRIRIGMPVRVRFRADKPAPEFEPAS